MPNISDSTPEIILEPRLAQTPATSSVIDEHGDNDSVELQTEREDSEGVLNEDEPGDEELRLARPAWRTLPRSTRRIRKPRPSIEPNLIVPDEGSLGLFGPHSPRSYEPHPDQPLNEDEPGDEEPRLARPAWRTLPRSTRRIRKPHPSIEPHLIVPDEGSPGLFGPRSPRSYEPHPDQPPSPEPGPAPMRQPVHS
ncbi:hypothetical protein BDR04DRAFT_1162407 [Suillus decipiens]|nr:hypothetical protein BDR04DRAFT_1162407 [Suillus decipiens]